VNNTGGEQAEGREVTNLRKGECQIPKKKKSKEAECSTKRLKLGGAPRIVGDGASEPKGMDQKLRLARGSAFLAQPARERNSAHAR